MFAARRKDVCGGGEEKPVNTPRTQSFRKVRLCGHASSSKVVTDI